MKTKRDWEFDGERLQSYIMMFFIPTFFIGFCAGIDLAKVCVWLGFILIPPVYVLMVSSHSRLSIREQMGYVGCVGAFFCIALYYYFSSSSVTQLYSMYLEKTCDITMEETTCCVYYECLEVDQYAREECFCLEYEDCKMEACMIGGEPYFLR
jgi:hypothetical protein